ncbi:MAG: exodeoxyribonuclease VII small subunit [Gammaproteobacteria bacterium]|nr:exodeoxyribonuclease VII small subunit [Gammaproteobacteria bacterium]MDH5629946.1 exodeoxyribonuclease VII small subunit [Gammaproteobacteria bacterium]
MSSKQNSFESQLSELESIVEQLEKGDLPLEDSLKLFEKGVGLTRQCQQLLDKAQQKVSILTQDGDVLEPFEKE